MRTLNISFEDEKCGEWGGDIDKFIIYRDDFEGLLFADYQMLSMNCDNPYGKPAITKDLKRIKITKEQEILIAACITELASLRLSTQDIITHSGSKSKVILSDSTLVLNIYPSPKWTNFEMLKKELISK